MATAGRVLSVGGVSFRVHERSGSVDGQFWDAYVAGTFEPATVEAFCRLLGPGRTLLDVGAWVGPFALYAAALGARVTAIEADPVAVEALRANAALNPELAERIDIVPMALARRAGTVSVSGGGHALGAGRSRVGDRSADAVEVAAFDVGGLDALVDLGSFDVIKIDIEGGEYAVVPELARRVHGQLPTLLLSLHGPNSRGRTTPRLLALRLRHAPARLRLLWSLRAYPSVRRVDSHRDVATTRLRRRDLALLAFRLGETELFVSKGSAVTRS